MKPKQKKGISLVKKNNIFLLFLSFRFFLISVKMDLKSEAMVF